MGLRRRRTSETWIGILVVRPLRMAILALSLIGAAAVVALEPAIAAYACPNCFGLVRVAPGVYIDEPAVAGRALAMIDAARRRVERTLGPVETATVILICRSRDCEARLDGRSGAEAMTYGWHLVRISNRGFSERVLVHELTHVAVHRRLGLPALVTGRMPAWWDEGLAVIVAEGRPAGCRPDTSPLPETALGWRRAAAQREAWLYPRAACRTAAWLAARGGMPGAMAMIAEMAAGADFRP